MTAVAALRRAVRTPRRPAGLARRTALLLGPGMSLLNLGSGLWVGAFILLVLPSWPHEADPQRQAAVNAFAFTLYAAATVAVTAAASLRRFRPVRAWLCSGEPPDDAVRRTVLGLPRRLMRLHVAAWLLAEAVFVPLNAGYSGRLAVDIAVSLALGATTVSALAYLTAERVLRPVAQVALDDGRVPGEPFLTVRLRIALAWLLGTGIPVLGVGLALVDRASGSARGDFSVWPLLLLVGIGLLSGGIAMGLAARAVADPVSSVTAALAQVEAGREDVRVPVYDGSEIGQLQSGFNAMVEAVRERRRLADLFGRHVGAEVAQQALERGLGLGGELVVASALFVDVIGSTSLAHGADPQAVVAALNDFFAVVVEVVQEAGGTVNKFEGDAALCVFGAPVPRADHATRALAAARRLRDRLAEVRGLQAGIGVAAGPVVAGNVGTAHRYEYTVIGDPVNEAARLTELAKQHPGRLLASADAVHRADPAEQEHWRVTGSTRLRGRSAPTGIAEPA